MSEQRVVVSVEDHIATVVFNRPEKRNALDGEQFSAIAAAGAQVAADPSVRAVIVTGEGASFCAGLDFSGFAAMMGDGDGGGTGNPGRLSDSGLTHLGQQVCWVWQEVQVPVIAAMHGHALGGGLQIALGADIRVAHPDTKLSVREIHWGIIPDMTGTYFLPRLVGDDVARELTFTGRVFDAREGAQLGLVTRLNDEPLTAARDIASSIAERNPDALRAAKRLLGGALNRSPAEQFAMERTEVHGLIGTPNQTEAIRANLEDRPAVFADPA